jgi:glycolate oxidase iron-sulfur subunit
MSATLPVVSESTTHTRTPPVGAPAALKLDPRTYERGLTCVHCGLCLPSCPTYVQTGHEADSPRGRIQLMLGLAEGKFDATPTVRKHLDLCLDCRACETACPSGVIYHELIEETRAKLSPTERRTAESRLMRWIFFNVMTRPRRLKLALLPARVMQKLGLYSLLRKSGIFNLLPPSLRKMERMLPESHSDKNSLFPSPGILGGGRGGGLGERDSETPTLTLPRSTGRGDKAIEVSVFPGCIGSVLFDKVNRQSVDLLRACGAHADIDHRSGCCGAIHLHNGDEDTAQQFARRNIDADSANGLIVTAIAGCGAMLREYGHLLRDDPQYAQKAEKYSARVRDISEALSELGLPELTHAINQAATYHDACHLAHAQKVTAAPRSLLAQVPGLKLTPLPDSDMCCGAAGTYNLTQPEMSQRLASRKLENISSTGATLCITGNVGCALQIQSEAEARGQKLSVVHPVEVLHAALFGTKGSERQPLKPFPAFPVLFM